MPVFPTPPSITSRIAQGTPLTFEEADTNFGNLTASVDQVISVIQTASYVDQSNTYAQGTTQSFSSISATKAIISDITASKAVFNGAVQFNGAVNIINAISTNITGSLFGTSSWAETASNTVTADTASYVATSSWSNTSIYSNSSSYILLAQSASYVQVAQTASYVATASTATYVLLAQTASFVATASWAVNSSTASFINFAQSASYVATASYMPSLQDVVNKNSHLSGSLFITGSLSNGSSSLVLGQFSHAEGFETTAKGFSSHAEGQQTIASGSYSHAEGIGTLAIGIHSHAEGQATTTIGAYSHAEGEGTIASGSQHVEGRYNIVDPTALWIVGDGVGNFARKNLITAHDDKVSITGSLDVLGSITGSLLGNIQGTSSFALLTDNALTSINALNAITSSYALTASYALSGASGSPFSGTASYLEPLTQSVELLGDLNITGSINAISINVIYVTSSQVLVTGSTVWGDSEVDTHEFTGSVYITGSLNVTNGITGSLFGTSSWSETALLAITSSHSLISETASYTNGLSVGNSLPNVISNVANVLEIDTTNGGLEHEIKLTAWNGTSEVLMTDKVISLDAEQTRVEQYLTLPTIGNYADDTEAAANGVPLWGVYRSGNILSIRIS